MNMKRHHGAKWLALVTAIALVFGIVQVVQAAIDGTSHDFAAAAWNSTGEMCIVCHTTHNPAQAAAGPLWNHELTTQTFVMYSSGTLDADTSGGISGDSKLCLSCHDGVSAMDNFGGTTTGTALMGAVPGNLGTNLSDSHPVSIDYTAAGGGLNATTTVTPLGGTVQSDLLGGGVTVECSSCHDPHDNTNAPFLIMANTNSQLCTSCHAK